MLSSPDYLHHALTALHGSSAVTVSFQIISKITHVWDTLLRVQWFLLLSLSTWLKSQIQQLRIIFIFFVWHFNVWYFCFKITKIVIWLPKYWQIIVSSSVYGFLGLDDIVHLLHSEHSFLLFMLPSLHVHVCNMKKIFLKAFETRYCAVNRISVGCGWLKPLCIKLVCILSRSQRLTKKSAEKLRTYQAELKVNRWLSLIFEFRKSACHWLGFLFPRLRTLCVLLWVWVSASSYK